MYTKEHRRNVLLDQPRRARSEYKLGIHGWASCLAQSSNTGRPSCSSQSYPYHRNTSHNIDLTIVENF